MIQDAMSQHRAVARKEIPWPTDVGESRYLDLEVLPLVDAFGETLGVQLSFSDVSRYRRLQEELERSKNELETAYEELQSSNEELETMNEELQSMNDELHVTNEELRLRTMEVGEVNSFMESASRVNWRVEM